MTSLTINPGDAGNGDIADVINAALQDPTIDTVILGEGVFLVHKAITVPSGKTLLGTSTEGTIIQAAEDFARTNGEGDGVVQTEWYADGVTMADFTIDAAGLFPQGFRLHGCFMRGATDFSVNGVNVENSTGYAHIAQGDANTFTTPASGTYEDCWTFNSQIHFEQMFCDGVTLINCHARDGDGILNGTYFHPLTGSRNITYIGCTGEGYANNGVEATANVLPLENIRFIDCRITMFGDSVAMVVAGGTTYGFHIENSQFISHSGNGALLYGVQGGTAVNSHFQGDPAGIFFYPAPDGTLPSFIATDSTALGLGPIETSAAAYGIAGNGDVQWIGGSIEARARVGLMFPLGSTGLAISPETVLIDEGYDSVLRYTRNDAGFLLGTGLAAEPIAATDFAGGRLTLFFGARGAATDLLEIRSEGSGPGQIEVSGSDVLFEGTVFGTVAGGATGVPLTVSFLANASVEAVAALVGAISYANTANGVHLSRDVVLRLTDAAGGVQEINLALLLSDNQAPHLALHGGTAPPGAPSTYVEGDDALAIAPAADLVDLDSPNLAGGALVVSIVKGGGADQLVVQHVGDGAGEIGVSEDTVSYGGIAFGTMSGGNDGTPLLVNFTADATPEAVEALIHAIAYVNRSDGLLDGTRTIRFEVTDGSGAPALPVTTSIGVSGIDDPTVVADDNAETDEASAIAISLLDNDVDPDSSLSVVAINGQTLAIGESLVLASGGRVTLWSGGQVIYDPFRAFDSLTAAGSGAVNTVASDSFTYSEAGGGTATVTVTIHGLAGAGDLLQGGAGNDMITGTAGADRFDLAGGGSDVVAAGAGADFIAMGASLSAGDRIDGGADFDTLLLTGSFNILLSTGRLLNVEQIDFEADRGGPVTATLRVVNDAVAAGTRMVVTTTKLGALDVATFNGSAETDGSFLFQGGAGRDVVLGGALSDDLFGGDGRDELNGGGGNDLVHGGGGDDLLLGGNGADTLNGGDGNDSLVGQDGDDYLSGDLGADTLSGADGNDYLVAGSGADNLSGGNGNDTLIGQDGDDYMEGGAGVDTLYGGIGADTLNGGDEADTGYGEDGNDRLVGQGGTDHLDGGAGDDIIYGGLDRDYLLGGLGNDVIYGEADGDTLLGNEGNDTLYGGDGQDAVHGGAGVDYLIGGSGGDLLYGGDDADMILGEADNDLIDGGAGADSLYGGAGADHLSGGADADRIYGEADHDSLYGQDGDDLLNGGAGADILNGGSGADHLEGGTEGDLLYGGAGVDRLFGGDGNDQLEGGDDADELRGDAGDDYLLGGLGADRLTGGLGADRFAYQSVDQSTAAAADFITDFKTGEDKLDLSLVDADGSQGGNAAFSFVGTNAFSGARGELRVTNAGGAWTVEGDIDGDRVADIVIIVSTTDGAPLAASDFYF